MLFERFKYRPYLFDEVESVVILPDRGKKLCFVCISKELENDLLFPMLYMDTKGYIILSSYNYPLMILKGITTKKYIKIITADTVEVVFKDRNPDFSESEVYQEVEVDLDKNSATTKSALHFKQYHDNFKKFGLTDSILYNEVADIDVITDKCCIESNGNDIILHLNKHYDEKFKYVDIYVGKHNLVLFKQDFPVVIVKNVARETLNALLDTDTVYVNAKKNPSGFLSSYSSCVIETYLADAITERYYSKF
ncbi:MAG: hypothetical protein R3Y27_02705 [Clostridia bacterium]